MSSGRQQAGQNGAAQAAGGDEVLQRAMKLIASGKYQKAVDLLNAKATRDGAHQNVKGVCLMRLGQHEQAVRLFRSLVLNPGCTWMRADAPLLHKVNFATSLLVSGHPSGCLETLGEIREEQDPRVQQLRATVARWVSGLSLWQKFNWWFGRIEPKDRPVQLDFDPGDFGLPVPAEQAPQPGPPPTRTAA